MAVPSQKSHPSLQLIRDRRQSAASLDSVQGKIHKCYYYSGNLKVSKFQQSIKLDQRCPLPAMCRVELFIASLIAPLLETNIRSEVCPLIGATDASKTVLLSRAF